MDKHRLRQYRFLVKEIAQIEDEKIRLASGMIGAVRITDMPKGSNAVHDPMAEAAAKLADLSRLLATKLNDVISLRIEIERAINSLDEPRERLLIRLRYIEGRKWEQIALDMEYDYYWVLKLHKKALNKISH